jgi:hypothetical protein
MTIEFKVYYDNEAATPVQLDKIEEIIVEQQINRIWEARVKFLADLSSEGAWSSEGETLRAEFTRVRIEVRFDENDFAPLIDGRIVGHEAGRSRTPGASVTTLIVHDDSSLLHREDESILYESEKDSDIAREILEAANLGGTPDIDDTSSRPDTVTPILQRGTKMQILRSLAAQNGNFYAYVLPGANAGESVGCFKKLPESPDESLPALCMFGEDRNLAEFNIKHNARAASKIVAATLSMSDKSVTTGESSYGDAVLRGENLATNSSGENLTLRRLPPGSNLVDLDGAAIGAAESSSFTLEADGSVLPFRYNGVLSPYRIVPVRLSDSRFSTNYVIFRVTHTLNHSNYTQAFTVRGNAVSTAGGGSGPANIF